MQKDHLLACEQAFSQATIALNICTPPLLGWGPMEFFMGKFKKLEDLFWGRVKVLEFFGGVGASGLRSSRPKVILPKVMWLENSYVARNADFCRRNFIMFNNIQTSLLYTLIGPVSSHQT